MQQHDPQEVLHTLYWKKCAPDWDTSTVEEKLEAFDFFCRNFVHIRHPERGKIKFELFDAQRDTVRTWLEHKDTLALKARQIGFSTVVSVYALWLTYFYEDRTVIMISKGQREASQLLTHAKYAYRMFPEWLRLWGPPQDSDTREVFTFCNASAIESAPSAADPARGRTAHTVVVDEIGFLPNSEDAWASIEPVADVGGRVVMLGTANGEGNLFHREWMRGKGTWTDRDDVTHQIGTGDGRFRLIFHGWWANGRNQDWFDAKCAELPEWQRAQEYPDNPDEAFLKSGNPVFDVEALRRYATEDPLRGFIAKVSYGYEFIEQPGGELRVWKTPRKGARYCIGADVAEGLEHGDYSSAHVIDVENDEVVAKWHGKVDPDIFGEKILFELGHYYNECLIGVEVNNHGLTTLKFLQRAKYRFIYRQKRLGSRVEHKTEQLGWRTTAASKPRAIDELHRLTRDNILVLPDSETIAEMRVFVRHPDGKMEATAPNNDDRVMSLAIAVMMIPSVYLPEYSKVEKPGPGTMGDWDSRMFDDDQDWADPFARFGYRNAS